MVKVAIESINTKKYPNSEMYDQILIDVLKKYLVELILLAGFIKMIPNKILYLGMGVSGGTEGVLNGPSMMIGGDINAFNIVKKDFSLITSKTIDESSSFDFFW